MKLSSSKLSMQSNLEYLSEIKKVDPQRDIYADILDKINESRKIPIAMASFSVIIFLFLISSEFFFVQKMNREIYKSELSQLFQPIESPFSYE